MNRRQIWGLGLITLTLLVFAWATLGFTVYLPIVGQAPSPTPTYTPTATPTPTRTPTATATRPLLACPGTGPSPANVFYTSQNKVRGEVFRLKDGQGNCVMPGEDVWFYFEARNLTGNTLRVGGLGALWCQDKPGGQCTQASWGDFDWIPPYADMVIAHEDHLNIYVSGTYQVRLGICWLGSRTDCENNPGQWDYLSSSITVVIR